MHIIIVDKGKSARIDLDKGKTYHIFWSHRSNAWELSERRREYREGADRK